MCGLQQGLPVGLLDALDSVPLDILSKFMPSANIDLCLFIQDILIMDSLEHIPVANVLLGVQRVAFSWCQEHPARILDVFLDTNCIHAGSEYHP